MQLTNKDKKVVKKFIKYWIKRCKEYNEYIEHEIDQIIIRDVANMNHQQDPIMEFVEWSDPWVFDSVKIVDVYGEEIIFDWILD